MNNKRLEKTNITSFYLQVKCENVHFQCDATDVNYILGKYHDTDVHGEKIEIKNAKCCMLKKCGKFVTKETKKKINAKNIGCGK